MHDRRLACVGFVVGIAVLVTGCSDDPAPQKPRATAACPKTLPKPSFTVPLSQIYLNIYNASATSGLASKAAGELTWRGAHVLKTGNDPNPDGRPEPRTAEIRHGRNGRQVALNLASQVQNAVLYQDDRSNPTVDLVLGDAFKFVPVPPPPAQKVTVRVYNTTFKGGLSGTVAAGLRERGFQVAANGNDPNGGYFPDDTAIIRHGEFGEPAARRVQLSIKGARLVKDGRKDETLDVMLGSKFEELVPAAEATPAPAKPISGPPGC